MEGLSVRAPQSPYIGDGRALGKSVTTPLPRRRKDSRGGASRALYLGGGMGLGEGAGGLSGGLRLLLCGVGDE